ncbi:cytochrome P450 [Micromonospora sp. R77]|uniref:cytochrome P450 n=1 Tax=Micromonospora sp. R77 TaxID=2925836 RepID=UPI001F6198D7|nr:cytochrome P450 [Micromonospora sp. R77]MCI4061456.1 cytochrome P450 [Micromonospora sp. R77]
MVRLGRDPLTYVTSLNDTAGVHVFRAFGQDLVHLTDPVLVKEMLVDRRGDFEKGVFFDRVRRLVGNGVVTANGAEHRRQRVYLDRFFKREHVIGLAGLMTEVVREDVVAWDGTVDLDAALHRVAFKILGATMFGTELDAGKFDGIHEWLAVVLESAMLRTVVPGWYLRVPTKKNRLHDTAMDRLRSAIVAAMNSHRGATSDRLDLVSVMRSVDGPDGKPLSSEEIADQIVSVTLAGAETAATALAWLTVELASDQALQDDLREELAAARARGVEYGPDLAETPLLKRVLSEVLRSRQPIFAISRRTVRDTVLGGLTLPGGTEVLYSPWAMHRDHVHFPVGPSFDPWSSGTSGCPISQETAFMPFGLGPRHCVGERYAWQMMWIVVGEVLAAVRIESAQARYRNGRPLATVIPGPVDAIVRRLPPCL